MLEKKIKSLFDENGLKFLFSEYQDIISALKTTLIDLPSRCYSRVSNSFALKVVNDSFENKKVMGFNENLRGKVFPSLGVENSKADLYIPINYEFKKYQYKKYSVKLQK